MFRPAVKTDLVDVSKILKGPCRFLYKKETQQPSGSFKLRGMSKIIAQAIEKAKANDQKAHIFTSSGGNAGLAAAYASKYHGVPCTVALPKTSKKTAHDKLRLLGADVIVEGAHWGEADEYLKSEIIAKVSDSVKPVYCHPFDDPILWDGHAALVDELVDQLNEQSIAFDKVKGIVCSCGGGGLYNGIVAGLKRNEQLQHVPVLVIETNQTPTFKHSVDAGKPIILTKIDTLSTSLAAPFIAQQTFDNYNLHPTAIELIDDLEAVDATVAYLATFDEVIEPACGATVAISMKRQDLLKGFGTLKEDDVIIFVVCGGSTVSEETMESYRQILAERSRSTLKGGA